MKTSDLIAMANPAYHVVRRFQHLVREIEAALLSNAHFRTLCEDYGEAVDALSHWERSTHPQKDERCAEYRKLLRDLEGEILLEIQSRSVP